MTWGFGGTRVAVVGMFYSSWRRAWRALLLSLLLGLLKAKRHVALNSKKKTTIFKILFLLIMVNVISFSWMHILPSLLPG